MGSLRRQLIKKGQFPSWSKHRQDAATEKLQRLRRVRFAEECPKLQPGIEQAAAEELLCGEAEWPEY